MDCLFFCSRARKLSHTLKNSQRVYLQVSLSESEGFGVLLVFEGIEMGKGERGGHDPQNAIAKHTPEVAKHLPQQPCIS